MSNQESDFFKPHTIEAVQLPTSELGIWPGTKIAFACAANHGRSQMAEAIFKTNYPNIEVASGGHISRTDEYDGNAPNPLIVQVLQEQGFETTMLQVKQLTPKQITNETDLVTFVAPDVFKTEIVNTARSVIYIPMEDPSVSIFIWGKQPPIDKKRIVESFKEMKELITNRLRNILLQVRFLEQEIVNKNIYYPVSNIYKVSGQIIQRVPKYGFEK